jgi:hypothetical protein
MMNPGMVMGMDNKIRPITITGSTYAWRIDKDFIPDGDASEGTNFNAKGVTGPRDASDDLIALLDKGHGDRFRMYDDDGGLYYGGRIVGEYDGFEPLDDFGMPNAGATEIKVRMGDKWVLV